MKQLWLTPGLLDDNGFITKSPLALPLQWGCADHHCRAPFWTAAVGTHANCPTPPSSFLVPSFLKEPRKNKISKASVMFLKGGEGQGQEWIGYLVPFHGGKQSPYIHRVS